MSTERPPITIVVEPLAAAAERDAPAPDLIEPIVGFRSWRIFRSGDAIGELSSPYFPVTWSERVLRADCRRQRTVEELLEEPHAAPAPGCSCGISAYHEPTTSFSEVDFRAVSGIVTVWGRIELDRGGMRAQLARVEALGLNDRSSRRQQQAVRHVAGDLGVDLINLREVGAAATSYGRPLPRSLLDEERRDGVRERFAAIFNSRLGD
jgi:hypothetical protein